MLSTRKENKYSANRKSGMPAAVLMPAPVWTTTCLAASIHSARRPHFSLRVSALSYFCKHRTSEVINRVSNRVVWSDSYACTRRITSSRRHGRNTGSGNGDHWVIGTLCVRLFSAISEIKLKKNISVKIMWNTFFHRPSRAQSVTNTVINFFHRFSHSRSNKNIYQERRYTWRSMRLFFLTVHARIREKGWLQVSLSTL